MARLRTPTLACLARLRFGQLPRLVLASARLVCRALCHVQTAQAKHLHVVLTAEVLGRNELVRFVYLLLQPEKPTRVRRLRRAGLWLLVPCDRLYRVDQVYPLDRAPRPPGLFSDPMPGCLLRARRRELAAEHFLDFQL